MTDRPMKPIPISAAALIADAYGYDQVVILARRVGNDPAPYGEHISTYGINDEHCRVAAMMGAKLKEVCGWPPQTASNTLASKVSTKMREALGNHTHPVWDDLMKMARAAIDEVLGR